LLRGDTLTCIQGFPSKDIERVRQNEIKWGKRRKSNSSFIGLGFGEFNVAILKGPVEENIHLKERRKPKTGRFSRLLEEIWTTMR